MKKLHLVLILLLGFGMTACNSEDNGSTKNVDKKEVTQVDNAVVKKNKVAEKVKIVQEGPNEGVFATIATEKGDIRIKLAYQRAPLTVANFVALAEGSMENNLRAKGEPFFDGLNFHRVITKHNGDSQDFMIQGGCPQMNGRGNPGYKFQDEFHPELVHDRPGVLSMANSGPKTNGSQFFITVAPTPHLNRKHSVFGHVVGGLDVVTSKIVKADGIKSVTIEKIGENAQKFDAMKVFNAKAQVVKR